MSTSTSVVRALRILELLSRSERSLAAITDTLDIPVSTAHGILAVLVEEGFVQPAGTSGFSIGLKAFETGAAYLRTTGAVRIVAPELARLTGRANVTSHWAVLDGHDAVYLCKEDPPGLGVRLASSVGARLPAHVTAVGKSCLAWLDWERAARHIALTGSGAERAVAAVRAELDEVRRRGYSVDDGETAAGIVCVAAPVFDAAGPCGAIGVSFPRGADTTVEAVSAQVRDAATRATSSLGGKEPCS